MSEFNDNLRTVTPVPPTALSRLAPTEDIAGFTDIFISAINQDAKTDTRMPEAFRDIVAISGIASEGVRQLASRIVVNGEHMTGTVAIKNEPLTTFGFQDYQEQLIAPIAMESYIDYSSTQGYSEANNVVTLEAFAIAAAYPRYLRQVELSLFIKDITRNSQTVVNVTNRIPGAATTVHFNPAVGDPTQAIDFSGITPTSKPDEIAAIVATALAKIWSFENFRGQQPIILIPSNLWYQIADALRLTYAAGLVRSDFEEFFIDNTRTRRRTRYNVMVFKEVSFIGVPSNVIDEFGVGFKMTLDTGFPADYKNNFADNLGVVFFPGAVYVSEQSMDLLVGINRILPVGDGGRVQLAKTDILAIESGQKAAREVRAMILDGVAQGRMYSDFANVQRLYVGDNPMKVYTHYEFLTRSDNRRISTSSRFKVKNFRANGILYPNGAISIKLPGWTPPPRSTENSTNETNNSRVATNKVR